MTMQYDDTTARRSVPAVAAGGAAAASSAALTQQARAKGPPIWLDMDQQALDDAYDQVVYAPNREQVAKRRIANSDKARAVLGAPERVGYGPSEIEKLDIYRTKRPNAPVNIFIHGGAWRANRAADYAFLAEPFVNAGAHLSRSRLHQCRRRRRQPFSHGRAGAARGRLRLPQCQELWRRSRAGFT